MHGVFLPLRTDTRVHYQSVVRRLDTKDELGYRIPVPCCGTREPAVLCLTRFRSILSCDHLRVYVRLNLVESAVRLCV